MRQAASCLALLLLCVGNGALASRAAAGLATASANFVDGSALSQRRVAMDVDSSASVSYARSAQLRDSDEVDDDYEEYDQNIDDKSLLLEAERLDLSRLPAWQPAGGGAAAAAAMTAASAAGASVAAGGAGGTADGGELVEKSHDDDDDDPGVDPEFCHKNRYRKRTLKVVKEMPFVGLFPELQRTRRFEGSGITYANGSYWVVFDSLRSLGRLDLRFSFRGPENRLVGPAGEAESQFEGIAYDEATDSFLVLRESMESEEHGLVPLTEELRVSEDGGSYTVLARCPVRFPLQDANKGFESLALFRRGGQRHMLGLCESNYCKTVDGPDAPGLRRGNGRLVWATYRGGAEGAEGGDCSWEVQKVIKLPPDAYLLDYSAIAFRGGFGSDVAVVSQQDAAVWVGAFDWEAMEFVRGEEGAPAGRVYHFPRTPDCGKQYCNVEGVAWIDGERLVLASDKAKRTQDHRCMDKDQSVHIMALP